MKIFLTGASGYLGSVIAERLTGKGYKVSGIARNERAASRLRSNQVDVISGTLSDLDLIVSASKNADAVIHTAFSHEFESYDDAVKLDRQVVEAFGGALKQTNKPFIVTSSSAVLGETGSLPADEDRAFDRNSSRLLRGETERDVLQMPQVGIRAIVFRLPLFVYGRGGSSFLPFLIEQAKLRNFAEYIEPGTQQVSAVHVEDAAEAYLQALETSTAKGLYNISAETVSMRDLSRSIARMLNIEARQISRETARQQFGTMFEFLSVNNRMSAEKAVRELRWTPSSYHSIVEEIENGSYRAYARGAEKQV